MNEWLNWQVVQLVSFEYTVTNPETGESKIVLIPAEHIIDRYGKLTSPTKIMVKDYAVFTKKIFPASAYSKLTVKRLLYWITDAPRQAGLFQCSPVPNVKIPRNLLIKPALIIRILRVQNEWQSRAVYTLPLLQRRWIYTISQRFNVHVAKNTGQRAQASPPWSNEM